ncbi:MAG: glycosyltransferase family 2 protein [Bacteroidota bacterium]
MEKLSIVIITFNEERNIRRCLESVMPIADEVIVVDSFSTDSTEIICSEFDVHFIKQEFLGYIEQKNFALKFANNKYVLSLDADESLSETLKSSILEKKNNFSASGYSMNRLTNYCGKWVNHCGWYPDKKLRLFNKNLGFWGGVNPHDEFLFDSNETVIHLVGDLLHYSYHTLDDHFKQVEKFTNISSQAYHEKGKKAPLWKLWLSPVIKFIRDYFILLGVLDGKTGFRICYISAGATYLKYKKLRLLNKNAMVKINEAGIEMEESRCKTRDIGSNN